MSLYNELSLGSAMDDGASQYMLDGNNQINFHWVFSVSAHNLIIRFHWACLKCAFLISFVAWFFFSSCKWVLSLKFRH